jgi:hypothetical protein
LEADERFENVKDIEGLLRVFVARCFEDTSADHVSLFLSENAQSVITRTCYIPVEHLDVPQRAEAFGLVLLPPDDPAVPKPGNSFSLDKPVGSVAAVEVTGSDTGKMASRARARAARTLRLLRIALRANRQIHDKQLRFTLSDHYAFNEIARGWKSDDDAAYGLGFAGDLVDLATTSPLTALTTEPSSEILKKADLATRWMERAWLTGDRLVALLYLFFALEALLGDKSEGLKAQGIAYRQMLLGHIVEGRFSHPNSCWFLYEKVRSAAVHGEDVPEIDDKVLTSLAWDVRGTLERYLEVAASQGFQKRSRLLRFLDEHDDQALAVTWLRENGGEHWEKFFSGVSSSITFGPEADGLGPALATLCEQHLAVALILKDGERVTGVLSEVAGDVLLVHGFDEAKAVETDDLTPIALSDIKRVEIT